MLNQQRFVLLFEKGLDLLIIDNYDDNGKLIKSVEDIYLNFKNTPYSKKTKIILRRKNEILSNRSGLAPNAQKKQNPLGLSCYLPFKQLIIRPDGKVSLCCYDSYGRITLGDLTKEKIIDVWYGKKHFSILNHLYKKGRNKMKICEACDTAASKTRVWGGIGD
jgi:radical SAM protein with 4Fe4S-binding SPASM domain